MDHSHHDHAHHDHGQHLMQILNSTISTTASAISSFSTTTMNPHAGHDHAGHEHHDHAAHIAASNDNIPTDDSVSSQHVHNHPMGHHMMMMYFHFGYEETILFEGWQISSVGGLIGSMVAIFIMATLYEGLKYYREYLFWKTNNLLEYRPVAIPKTEISTSGNHVNNIAASSNNPNTPIINNDVHSVHFIGEVLHKQQPSMFSLMHFYQTFLHLLQVTLSFLLMLIFMTYNVWLCLAVVLGAGFGYYLFCWKKSVVVDVTEHCH